MGRRLAGKPTPYFRLTVQYHHQINIHEDINIFHFPDTGYRMKSLYLVACFFRPCGRTSLSAKVFDMRPLHDGEFIALPEERKLFCLGGVRCINLSLNQHIILVVSAQHCPDQYLQRPILSFIHISSLFSHKTLYAMTRRVKIKTSFYLAPMD